MNKGLGWAVSGVVFALCSNACASFEGRLQNVEFQGCERILSDHPALSADTRYREQSEGVRQDYEAEVALCYLAERKPEKALALASTWGESWRADSLRITARANAQLDKEAESRAALEALAKIPTGEPEFFLDTPEFKNYVHRDWFVLLALDVWSRKATPWLETFARKFARARGEGLLSLRVAAADAQRSPGEWALWLGIVRRGQINRSSGETLLIVEGLDLQNEGVVHNRLNAYDTGGNSVRVEQQIHAEAFVPNGQHFLVKFPGVNEGLVGMSTVLAFGRYLGRSEDNLPTLRASVVTKHNPNELVAERR